ncbi:hypothetical protein B0H14DRAFT_2634423 [Mycena olivaceomarginata]|nr:hypothetical protein B0H14DRAFT_2634423 [Mycena olivaceomarginata]
MSLQHPRLSPYKLVPQNAQEVESFSIPLLSSLPVTYLPRSKRNVRDLVLNAQINWELPWKRIPVQQKASLFDIARGRHPYLAEFHNDWATEEIVKQFIKNRRNNAYKNEWIPSAPRGRQNKLAKAGAASKAAEKKTAAPAGRPAKNSSKSKGKKKAVVDSEDDDADDDASMSNAGSEDSYDGHIDTHGQSTATLSARPPACYFGSYGAQS